MAKKNVLPMKFVDIPEGVEVVIEENFVTVKKNGKKNEKVFDLPRIKLSIEDKGICVSGTKSSRKELKMIGTISGHLKNMIFGLDHDFVYNLEIANVHFPMNVKVDGDKIIIKNFLGERVDRISKIILGSKVEIKDSKITVSSNNKESAGQTAANLEKATRVTGRDRRVFQDGIFIVNKCGKKI